MKSLINGSAAIATAIVICVNPVAWALDKAPTMAWGFRDRRRRASCWLCRS
jgi:hypothetical protein